MSNIFTDIETKNYVSAGLKFIADSWILGIVATLESQELRFVELQRELNTNPRTLTTRLKLLEQKGIIDRSVGIKDRQSVEYRLTQKGRDILPILREIKKFIQKYGLS